MADFVAVLRKTIGGLGETTPEMREKVFDKARATIEAKLAAIDPPPPAAVVERQRKALEDAIAVVRAEFDVPVAPEADDALDDILADFDKPAPPPAAPTPVTAPAPRADEPAPAPASPAPASPAPEVPAPESKAAPARGETADPAQDALHAPASERLAGGGVENGTASRRAAPTPAGDKPRRGILAAALGLVVLLALGGGYLWWSGELGPAGAPVAEGPAGDPGEPAATTAEDLSATPPDDEAAPSGEAAAEPEAAPPAAQEKFTQRLLPDGSEVDEGPTGEQPGIGEGSSIASAARPPADQTQAGTQPDAQAGEENAPGAEPSPGAGEDTASAPPQATDQPPVEGAQPGQAAAVTVGQRAIFYEERTSASEGSAEVGSIAWSLVQESPGGDLPPEPAIRAEATVPGKDVQLRMTIRRNGDQTLPASHIVEMIFLTPEGFEGGAIANVAHVAFKDTEQAPGRALIGIPAKIADGFFLIALSDAPAETQANLNMLQRQSWLDIPIVYQTGRRALLSMEKGIPGERVFQEALKAWSEASSG